MRHKFSEDDGVLYDVVAVSLNDGSILWVDENKTLPNAEAVVNMAIMRQGVEDRFFKPVPAGTYKKGDAYAG